MSDTELEEREEAADDVSGDKADKDESGSLAKAGAPASNFVFNAAAGATGLGVVASAFGFFARNKKRTAAGAVAIGGITAGFLLIGGFANFELTHFRENFLGTGNKLQNFSLSGRKAKSLQNQLEKLAKVGDKPDPADQAASDVDDAITKNPQKLTDEGFDIAFDDSGKLTKFGFEGEKINFGAADLKGEFDRFFASDVGDDAKLALEKAMSTESATWTGRAARDVYSRLGVGFENWLDDSLAKEDVSKTDTEKSADSIKTAEQPDSPETVSSEGVVHNSSEGEEANTNPVDGGTDTPSNIADELDTTGKKIPDDAAAVTAEEQAGQLGDDVVKAVGNKTGVEAIQPITDTAKTAAEQIGVGGALRDIAGGAAAALDPLLIAQTACKAKGTFAFIANARNVLLAVELARFSLRFLTAADHQKAGLLSTEGLKTYMLFLHREDPGTGGTFVNAGGVQNLLGNSDATVSTANLSKYSTSRANTGLFQSITNIIDSFPFANIGCNIANNGLINAGAAVVGGVFAVFSAPVGEAPQGFLGLFGVAGNILVQIGLAVATPYLIRLGAHEVFTGLESGLQGGEGIASGLGALFAMNGGSNGLRMATKQQVAELGAQEAAYNKMQLAHESFYERYMAMDNPQSLLARTSMASYTNFGSFSQVGQRLSSTISSIPSFFSSVATSFLPFKARVYAQDANNQCDDPQVRRLSVATDAFCNPLLVRAPDLDYDQTVQVLRNNNMLDVNGQPQGELADYLKDCHSGRAGLLYKEKVNTNGNDDPAHDDCITTTSQPLSGDNVNRFDRFTAWYGQQVDMKNMTDQLTGAVVATDQGTMFQSINFPSAALAGVR